jgi:hypothetical protein
MSAPVLAVFGVVMGGVLASEAAAVGGIPALPQAQLLDVTCTSTAACVGVGLYQVASGGKDVSLVEAWNGASWSIQNSPNPAGSSGAGLYGVSCHSATVCTAVGYATIHKNTTSFAERWNGRKWSLQSVPAPQGSTRSGLLRVSCGSGRSCVAIGFSSLGLLGEAWNGTTWSIEPIAAPRSTVGELSDVSCASAVDCIAVGFYSNDQGNDSALAEHWNGTTWSDQGIPNLATSPNNVLTGISCTSAKYCLGVGYGSIGVVTEIWNGKIWSVFNSPNNADTDTLADVSCLPSGSCYAVGASLDIATGNQVPAVEVWDESSWTSQQINTPPGSDDTYLKGVSCGSDASCVAVGEYADPGFQTLSEIGPATTWTMVAPVN